MTFLLTMAILLAKKAKIIFLFIKEVIIFNKYLYFIKNFLEKKALLLPQITDLNQHAIKLQESQQPFYKLI